MYFSLNSLKGAELQSFGAQLLLDTNLQPMNNIIQQLQNFPLDWINNLSQEFPTTEIYLVGGAVRDFIIGRETKDLDFVVRNVEPKKLEKFLAKHGKINFVGKSFGVYKFRPNNPLLSKEGLVVVEDFDIALPRTDHSFNTGGYKDVEVTSDYTLPIEKDLERRDFTINAIALKLSYQNNKLQTEIIDPFDGQKDIKNKIIKTVGIAEERFQEDATRMIRAVRFMCQLNIDSPLTGGARGGKQETFTLHPDIIKTIKQKTNLIKKIAPERIGEELNKIIASNNPELGFRSLQKLGILKIIIPELDACVGIDQSRNHIYPVFEHLVRALGAAAKKNYNIPVRWAALLHDVGKPPTKAKKDEIFTFYNHEYVSAKITKKILHRLRYSEKFTQKITHLVRHHMFYYNIGEITDSAVRRFVRKAGTENLEDLINLRVADRLGMGRPKGKPFKLIELERRIKEVSLDPLSVKMLKINGEDVMIELNIKPSPKIGILLNALLSEVLEDPKKNEREYLIKKLKELDKLTDAKLKKLAPDIDEYEEKRREEIIGKPLIYKGEKLKRKVQKIPNQRNTETPKH